MIGPYHSLCKSCTLVNKTSNSWCSKTLSNTRSNTRINPLFWEECVEECDFVSVVCKAIWLALSTFQQWSWYVHMFANDCLLYRIIESTEDTTKLQQDLNMLPEWVTTWQLNFNATKCAVIQCTRITHPTIWNYTFLKRSSWTTFLSGHHVK